QVRITGTAEVVRDTNLLQEIWNANKLLQHYLGTPDNPDLIVYRINPARVRFMLEWALEYYEVPLCIGTNNRYVNKYFFNNLIPSWIASRPADSIPYHPR